MAPSSENPPGSDLAAEGSSSTSRVSSQIGGLSALGFTDLGWEGISPGSKEFAAWMTGTSLGLTVSGEWLPE